MDTDQFPASGSPEVHPYPTPLGSPGRQPGDHPKKVVVAIFPLSKEELLNVKSKMKVMQKIKQTDPIKIILTRSGDCAHIRTNCPSIQKSEGLRDLRVCGHCLKMGPA